MGRLEASRVILYISAWMVVLFLVLPILVIVPVSFTDQGYLSFPKENLSMMHYKDVFSDSFWRDSLVNSFFVGAIAAVISTILGTFCAIGLWRMDGRTAAIIKIFMISPIIVPGIVMALAFYRVWIDFQLVDTFLGVIITHVILGIPYVIIVVSASLSSLDSSLESAAYSLGASEWQNISLVIVPNILPGILSGGLFAFVVSWDELVILLFITARKVMLLPRAIWSGINEEVSPTVAAVASLMILATIIALVVPVVIRFLLNRLRAGSNG